MSLNNASLEADNRIMGVTLWQTAERASVRLGPYLRRRQHIATRLAWQESLSIPDRQCNLKRKLYDWMVRDRCRSI